MAVIREDEMDMKERNACSIIGRDLQKIPVGRPICGWEFSMKTKLEVINCFASVCTYYLRIESGGDFCENEKEPPVSTKCSFLDHLNDFQSCKILLTFMWYCRKYVTMSMTCGGNGTNMSLLRI